MADLFSAFMGAAQKFVNQDVASTQNYSRRAPLVSQEGEVRLLIFALDYKRTQNPLTCSMDGRNMETLARACGVRDVTAMYNETCTKSAVTQAIRQVGGRCNPDDYFIVYYSGHGTSVQDSDGDEEDHKDEAFCFVDANGQINQSSLLVDDEFSDVLSQATDDQVRILILTDCCHSGTIADLSKEAWRSREAISITGCLDSETSGDMGRGGIFTHSMLLAIDELQDAGQMDYSVGMLYNGTLDKDNKVFKSAQNITIQTSAACTPDKMAWPLIPQGEYKAPLTQAVSQASGGNPNATAQDAMNIANLNPAILAQLGIKPQLLQFISHTGLAEGKLDPQQLLKAGLACYMSGGCSEGCCTQ